MRSFQRRPRQEGFNIYCTITQRTRTSFKILASLTGLLPGGIYVVSHQIGYDSFGGATNLFIEPQRAYNIYHTCYIGLQSFHVGIRTRCVSKWFVTVFLDFIEISIHFTTDGATSVSWLTRDRFKCLYFLCSPSVGLSSCEEGMYSVSGPTGCK